MFKMSLLAGLIAGSFVGYEEYFNTMLEDGWKGLPISENIEDRRNECLTSNQCKDMIAVLIENDIDAFVNRR